MTTSTLSTVRQAEALHQVVRVLEHVQDDFEDGRWCRGARYGADDRHCLLGAIDERTRWTIPGVREEVVAAVAAELPAPFRAVSAVRPRLGVWLFNDTVGGREGARRVVEAALHRLGAGSARRAADGSRRPATTGAGAG